VYVACQTSFRRARLDAGALDQLGDPRQVGSEQHPMRFGLDAAFFAWAQPLAARSHDYLRPTLERRARGAI
jgi:hypothetical protein